MIVLAHFGHWYESVLYLVPLVVVVLALWWSGRGDDESGDATGGVAVDAGRTNDG